MGTMSSGCCFCDLCELNLVPILGMLYHRFFALARDLIQDRLRHPGEPPRCGLKFFSRTIRVSERRSKAKAQDRRQGVLSWRDVPYLYSGMLGIRLQILKQSFIPQLSFSLYTSASASSRISDSFFSVPDFFSEVMMASMLGPPLSENLKTAEAQSLLMWF